MGEFSLQVWLVWEIEAAAVDEDFIQFLLFKRHFQISQGIGPSPSYLSSPTYLKLVDCQEFVVVEARYKFSGTCFKMLLTPGRSEALSVRSLLRKVPHQEEIQQANTSCHPLAGVTG